MITKQEMFNRAYRGLASQGWKRCVNPTDDQCLYENNGMRCAWGWVDTSLTSEHNYTAGCNPAQVDYLAKHKIGIAGTLTDELLDFACDLQNTHDDENNSDDLQDQFIILARKHGLKIPV